MTLDKSGKSFSPTTRYRDYAISPALFHWETQVGRERDAPLGPSLHRERRRTAGRSTCSCAPIPTPPIAFLGPVTYESHTGDRPIAITWRLANPMPAVLYERYATLRPG